MDFKTFVQYVVSLLILTWLYFVWTEFIIGVTYQLHDIQKFIVSVLLFILPVIVTAFLCYKIYSEDNGNI